MGDVMKKKLKLWIRCLFSAVHIIYVKIFNIRGFFSSFIQDLSLSTRIVIDKGGRIKIGKAIHTRKSVVLEAMEGGNIDIGGGCFFNNGCMIVSKERIVIGEKSSFGPNVCIYDHDHDTNRSELTENKYSSAPVKIGKRVWIGANSVVLRGTIIGDNCVIGAGSVIKGIYEPDSIVIQKRSTEIKKVNSDLEFGMGDDEENGRTEEHFGLEILAKGT